MAPSEKARQELEQIERQVAELESPGQTTPPAVRSPNCRIVLKRCDEK
jgi:hypothetical protein